MHSFVPTYQERTRGRDRLHLFHAVVARLIEHRWFSSRQVFTAVYWGSPMYRQSHKRVRTLLEQYVEAGILEGTDTIAVCTLYRHRVVTADQINQKIVTEFEAHAKRRWSPAYDLDLKLIEHDLHRLVPKDADPELYDRHGYLMDRELKAWMERPKLVPEKPRVLGYLGAGDHLSNYSEPTPT